jgi:tRNA threonylcarbamoyladenosine biosynthesis protein TsaB
MSAPRAAEPHPFVEPEPGWRAPPGVLPPDALVLAIDTSTRAGGVALCRGPAVVGEDTWLAAGGQTTPVLPAAARLCARAGAAPRDLSVIVVATGPGSFTGLRVGVSLGKGFAVALGIPLIGVATLDALAYQHRDGGPHVCAVVEAGRGQLYVGTYRRSAGRLRRAGDFQVWSAEELAAGLAGARHAWFVAGEIDAAVEAALAHALGGRVRIASPAARPRRPAYLAELGLWHLARDGRADAAALQPIYLRRAPAAAAS